MAESITEKEVNDLYEKLENPSKLNNFSGDSFFTFSEKDEHLAWKPLNI